MKLSRCSQWNMIYIRKSVLFKRNFIRTLSFLQEKNEKWKTSLKSWHSPTDLIPNFPWTCSSCSWNRTERCRRVDISYIVAAKREKSRPYIIFKYFCHTLFIFPMAFFIVFFWQIRCYYFLKKWSFLVTADSCW